MKTQKKLLLYLFIGLIQVIPLHSIAAPWVADHDWREKEPTYITDRGHKMFLEEGYYRSLLSNAEKRKDSSDPYETFVNRYNPELIDYYTAIRELLIIKSQTYHGIMSIMFDDLCTSLDGAVNWSTDSGYYFVFKDTKLEIGNYIDLKEVSAFSKYSGCYSGTEGDEDFEVDYIAWKKSSKTTGTVTFVDSADRDVENDVITYHSPNNLLKVLEIDYTLMERTARIDAVRTYQYNDHQFLPEIVEMKNQKETHFFHPPFKALITLDSPQNDIVKVGLIDTGVNYNLEAIQKKLLFNINDPIDGIDNDNNKHIDDFIGLNLDREFVPGPLPFDMEVDPEAQPYLIRSHGTSVALIDYPGNLDAIKLIPVKHVQNADEDEPFYDIELALSYLAQNSVSIVNMSLGFKGLESQLRSIVLERNDPLLIVQSAGNDGLDLDQQIIDIASVPNLISVAAAQGSKLEGKMEPLSSNFIQSIFGQHGRSIPAPFLSDQTFKSNYGRKTVDIAAPGINVKTKSFHGTDTIESGTSLAAPYITYLAAEIKREVPKLTPEELKTVICKTADIDDELKDKLRFGLVNRERALKVAHILKIEPQLNVQEAIQKMYQQEFGEEKAKQILAYFESR